jgi:carbonic anhydrase/acetyltransferase-like protein (isoleucine patch superfamily)
MAGVITTADPNSASAATLTGWFEAPRDAATAPIGTGLTPVVGDTASFTWAAGSGAPQAAYEYNGSIWIPVDGQVISGNVIVQGTIAGNAMIANTITATQIATGTITATQIAANTITANNIAANTITSNNIAANTITGNNIAAGTITTNNFTANTIQGNIIAAGTITAEQLAANAITANTVISSGAVLGSDASLGFWLDGPTGNARFGNSISIGNQLTVGSGANIGGGLIVGNTASIGNLLTVASNATIGGNLIIGNNASIGGNLLVTGLINGGNLIANTVSTTTVVPLAISSGAGNTTTASQVFSPAVVGTTYTSNLTLDFTTTETNQPLFVFAQAQLGVQFTTITSGSVDVTASFNLRRTNLSTGVITSLYTQEFDVYNVTAADSSTATFNPVWAGISDTVPTAGSYRYSITVQYGRSGTVSGLTIMYFLGRTLMVQTLKR